VKLGQDTRKRLYKAAPRSIEITWPIDGPDPHSGKRYAIYNEEGNLVFTILLERSKRGPYETKARVRIDSDPVRILPGLNGTRREDNSYETEPERVHADYEKLLAGEALQKTTLLSAEQRQRQKAASKGAEHKAGRGKQAREYAARAKRLESA